MTRGATVLVTGSSSGLGRQVAETLARQGATVYASMRGVAGKNQAAAAQIRQLAEQEQLALYPLELDVTDAASVERAVQTIVEANGNIDVVVNNAAVGQVGITEAYTVEHAQRIFDANVFGALRVTNAVLPHMRSQGSGLLIYISSTSSQIVVPFMSIYGASKAALEGLALSSHYELYTQGIDTVVMQLGGYATSFGVNIQLPERTEIAQRYGVAGQFAQGMASYMPTTMDGMDNPLDAALMIGQLVAAPAGQRPLKVIMGAASEGLESINEQLAVLQSGLVSFMGMDALTSREELQAI